MSTDANSGNDGAFALICRVGNAIFAVFVIQLFGFGVSFALSQYLSSYPGSEQLVPWSIILVTDYCLIMVSAALAELAAPKQEGGSPPGMLISWTLTSFIVATTTLAPLATYAVETVTGTGHDRLNFLTMIFGPKPWAQSKQLAFHLIVSAAAIMCLVLATNAALTLRGAPVKASGSDRDSSRLHRRSFGALIISIFLFCMYTLFTHEWVRAQDSPVPNFHYLIKMLVASIILVGLLSYVAGRTVSSVHLLFNALRHVRDQLHRDDATGSRRERWIFMAVTLVVITLSLGYLLQFGLGNQNGNHRDFFGNLIFDLLGESAGAISQFLHYLFPDKRPDWKFNLQDLYYFVYPIVLTLAGFLILVTATTVIVLLQRPLVWPFKRQPRDQLSFEPKQRRVGGGAEDVASTEYPIKAIQIYERSDLLCWWIVWLSGLICAFLTHWQPLTPKIVVWAGIVWIWVVLLEIIFTTIKPRGPYYAALALSSVSLAALLLALNREPKPAQQVPIEVYLIYLAVSLPLAFIWLRETLRPKKFSCLYFQRNRVVVKRSSRERQSETFEVGSAAFEIRNTRFLVHWFLGLRFLGFGDINVKIAPPREGKGLTLKNVWQVERLFAEIKKASEFVEQNTN